MMLDPSRYDSREERAKRIAIDALELAGRLATNEEDHALIEEFRQHWTALGAGWIRFDPIPLDPEDWLPAREIAEMVDVTISAVYKWYSRGHIGERLDANGRPLYNVGEVLKWLAEQRKRRASRTPPPR